MEKAVILLASLKGGRTAYKIIKKKGYFCISQPPQLYVALAAHQYSASTENVCLYPIALQNHMTLGQLLWTVRIAKSLHPACLI